VCKPLHQHLSQEDPYHIGNDKFVQTFDWRPEESNENSCGNPGAVRPSIGGPAINSDSPKERSEKYATTAISQGDRLPEKTTQPEEKKHVACASIEIAETEAGILDDGDENRVNRS
jgi:hypothetical protein